MFNSTDLELNKVEIQQRRYLGNKYQLLDFIKEIIDENIKKYDSFLDIFSGTGVVANHFNNKNKRIIANDLLYHNFITNYAYLGNEIVNIDKIINMIKKLNSIENLNYNYVAKNFGGRYFSEGNAKKIGEAREAVEKFNINFREKSILITSILYGMDKVANTCGHYDAYRKKMDKIKEIEFPIPKINSSDENHKNKIFNKDANELIKGIECDILYLDPPYNSRQYCDTYHLLENIAQWNKPKVHGVAKKFDRTNLKSDYNYKKAPKAFRNLIKNANCKYIILSYNDMGKKGHTRSQARIDDETIINTLESKGELEIYEKEINQYTTGKSFYENHKERIFFCTVNN